jgi:hypothetical protein
VTKTTLINLLGPSALGFAAYIRSDDPNGKALKVLFENIDNLDLNCDLVQQQMIPLLRYNNVITEEDQTRIQAYIADSLK